MTSMLEGSLDTDIFGQLHKRGVEDLEQQNVYDPFWPR